MDTLKHLQRTVEVTPVTLTRVSSALNENIIPSILHRSLISLNLSIDGGCKL